MILQVPSWGKKKKRKSKKTILPRDSPFFPPYDIEPLPGLFHQPGNLYVAARAPIASQLIQTGNFPIPKFPLFLSPERCWAGPDTRTRAVWIEIWVRDRDPMGRGGGAVMAESEETGPIQSCRVRGLSRGARGGEGGSGMEMQWNHRKTPAF